MRRGLLLLVRLYQRLLSPLSHGSCRYYPTCSEYARWQIEANALWRAPWAILLRLLRCNPLFAGGIDYPIVSRTIQTPTFKRIRVRYWLVPRGKGGSYYLIPNLD
ncbi:MAG: membrane protein insertion efficiency factor YidD [Nitratiruptor sp.]|nr:membrane protein insertion efficiency factor YidD [Nitratiruptor sp.]NPA84047.1 membrane protein insertion efficiency factor YidD [Campylobacterota bacterium]